MCESEKRATWFNPSTFQSRHASGVCVSLPLIVSSLHHRVCHCQGEKRWKMRPVCGSANSTARKFRRCAGRFTGVVVGLPCLSFFLSFSLSLSLMCPIALHVRPFSTSVVRAFIWTIVHLHLPLPLHRQLHPAPQDLHSQMFLNTYPHVSTLSAAC